MIVVVGELWAFSDTQHAAVAACAIVSHVVSLIPILTVGVYYLIKDSINVFAVADQATESAPPPAEGER